MKSNKGFEKPPLRRGSGGEMLRQRALDGRWSSIHAKRNPEFWTDGRRRVAALLVAGALVAAGIVGVAEFKHHVYIDKVESKNELIVPALVSKSETPAIPESVVKKKEIENRWGVEIGYDQIVALQLDKVKLEKLDALDQGLRAQPRVLFGDVSISLTGNPINSFASVIDVEMGDVFGSGTVAHEFGHILQQRSYLYESTDMEIGKVWTNYQAAFKQSVDSNPDLKGLSFSTEDMKENFASDWAIVTMGEYRGINAERMKDDPRYQLLLEVKNKLENGSLVWPLFEEVE